MGRVKQYIAAYTVHAHSADEAVQMVVDDHRDIKFVENEVEEDLATIVTEIPLGANQKEFNFTRRMKQAAAERREAQRKAAEDKILIPEPKIILGEG